MTKKYYPSAHAIFHFNEEGLVATDTYEKNAYAIDEAYFKRLLEWQSRSVKECNTQDQELKEAHLIVDTQINKDNWTGNDLSWLFYLSTRNPESLTPPASDEEVYESMIEFAASKDTLPKRPEFVGERIALPEPDLALLQEPDFYAVLKQRMTTRNFTTDPISLEQLSVLLFLTFGYIHGQDWQEINMAGLLNFGERKSSPSATGVQSCEAYIAAQYVTGLTPGLYRYNPTNHSLYLVRSGIQDDEFKHITCDQFWVREAACGLFIVFDSDRIFMKYEEPRALLLGFYEAGHLSQTTLLTATALGLRTWLSASLRDSYISEILKLESPRCFAITFLALGHGSNDPIPAKIKEALAQKQ